MLISAFRPLQLSFFAVLLWTAVVRFYPSILVFHLLNIVNPIQAGHNPDPFEETSVLLCPVLTVPYTPGHLSSIEANVLLWFK